MQTVTKKAVVESTSSKATTAKVPDIASVLVPNTLTVLHVNLDIGLTHGEVGTRYAANLAVAGARFAMVVAVG
jgi:hypothetical protein